MHLNVAKYHLGKVKPERVGQRRSPLQYVTFGAALRVLQALFCLRGYCCLRIVALPADRSGSLLHCIACWSLGIIPAEWYSFLLALFFRLH